MQKITPCLWFKSDGEAAARFYVSVFKRAKIGTITRYGEGEPMPKGTVMTVAFKLEGQDFLILNGGSESPFNMAISLMVDCADQAEVDRLWARLTADGGKAVQCGWLTDKYGISWQIVPSFLMKVVQGKDLAKKDRVMKAMMGMVKLDIALLKRAAAGR